MVESLAREFAGAGAQAGDAGVGGVIVDGEGDVGCEAGDTVEVDSIEGEDGFGSAGGGEVELDELVRVGEADWPGVAAVAGAAADKLVHDGHGADGGGGGPGSGGGGFGARGDTISEEEAKPGDEKPSGGAKT